jgi:hypothetical protein
MTVLDDRPRTSWTPRLPRRHEIVTTGGMAGVLDIGAALHACGFPVRDFAVDVRDGVPYSSITCTVSVTREECELFAARIGALPMVMSVEPC